MKRLLAALILCVQIFLLQGCVQNGTPIIAIGTPRFVAQSPPDSIQETGIRQDPNTGGIVIQWYRDPGASGYKLYRSDSLNSNGKPVDFQLRENISASGLNDTSTVDLSTGTGVKYNYYLTAYASDGSSSSPSDTISYTLLNRPVTDYPAQAATVDANGLYFIWNDFTGGGYTVIRVMDLSVVPNAVLWVTKRFQVFHTAPARYFNFDSTAAGQLVSGHSYAWRVERFDLDGSGRPFEGASSLWGKFNVK